MKKLKLFKSVFLFALLFSVFNLSAQFEGIIKFDKKKGTEVTKYIYYVKGNKVRIDEFGPDTVKGIMLIDAEKGIVTALSPDRKIYMDASNNNPPIKVNPKLSKTKNKKVIGGVKCTEWIVTSEQEETIVSYWVIDESKFSFFEPLLRTLNRKDRLSKYWLELKDIKGKFTMVGVEKSKDGTERTRLEVTEMKEEKLEDSLFMIPKDYAEFKK